ncbi:transcription factor grauzone [Drosophila willistoni]|uniref:GK21881 n=1 Tax=Drosophila willistoni TaxID=7260 RepID=B4MQI7_DROWI|nr:transcription factor grauzone [Drosophila willistoni]
MVACVLCLSLCSSETALGLSSVEGLRLNVRAKISKHFLFFELPQSEGSSTKSLEVICQDCWQIVRSFNEFYDRVFELHQHRSGAEEFCDESAGVNPLYAVELDALAEEGFFAPNEIKLEVNELEPLGKMEVDTELEDPVYTKEKKQLLASDSDGDRPLAELLSIATEAAPRRRSTRRGRPPKIRKESPPSPKQMKREFESDDDAHDMDFVAAEAVLGTDDSASSSDEDDNSSRIHSDGDSLPDIEPEERYAEIPKRVVVKPKKYRKRPKPVVPPVRLSREEIERRKEQQNEYDEIILSFFKKFPCDICNLLVQNFADMRRHQRMSHNIESGYINCCGRKFHIRKALAEHVLVHRNPDHFMCSQCGRVLQDSRTLELHEQSHSTEADGTGSGTGTGGETKEKRTYQCEKCPKSFTTKAAIEYHNVSKHVPKSEFKFTCPECNKKIPTERKLKEHLRYMHDPETAIICDKCGKTLRSQTNLKKHHELEHSDEPRPKPDPVQCEICGTWLRHLSGLKQHMNTVHEPPGGEHRCHICNKTSTNSRALKRHIYHNHLCERKFKCGMCEKAFKRPQDLREHTSTHTGEVLYTCPNCPMTFFSNANMYKHRQRLHRAEWEADRKKPLPPNIMKISQGATTAMKKRQAAAAGLFPQMDGIDVASSTPPPAPPSVQ